MTEISPAISKDLAAAFLDYERRVRISNYKVACIMAFIFMPAGASLDYFVYPSDLGEFLKVRLLCSALLALIWGLLQSQAGLKIYRSGVSRRLFADGFYIMDDFHDGRAEFAVLRRIKPGHAWCSPSAALDVF